MDTIESMSTYVKATESVEGVLAAVMISTIAACGMSFKRAAKKEAVKLSSSRKAYFERHNIEPYREATYEKEVYRNAKADAEKLIRTFINNPKSKPVLDNIRQTITKHVKEYINHEDLDETPRNDFEPNKLTIKFGIFNDDEEDGHYDMINVKYTGKGYIPADNLWEEGSMACHDIMEGFAKALSEKYAEEIACKFVSIDVYYEYGTLQIG
jgi:hypothetical protein